MPISRIGANGLNQTQDFVIDGLTVGQGGGNVATNTTVGASALAANTTGSFNDAFGSNAAASNTTGTNISAFGAYTLNKNTTGIVNSAFGGSNTIPALYNNTTGSYNCAFGTGTLFSNTTASFNTAVGYQAGYSNITGTRNTFLGEGAGYSQTAASGNTFIGRNAGRLTTGQGNTFIGYEAGYSVTTGNNNTFIGPAYSAINGGVGDVMTTGSNNVIIGRFTGNQNGLDIRTANNYVVLSDGDGTPRQIVDNLGRVGINSVPAAWIGNEQFYVAGSSGTANQFVGNIGVTSSSPSGACSLFLNYTSAAPNNTSNSYLICNDNSGVQKLNIFSNGTVSNRTGTYNSLSDLKLKENVVDATPKLDKLMQVKVRNYNLIGDELKQIGFVAQELEQVFPGLVEDVPDFDKNQQPTGEVTKMVKTSVLIPILVKAVQELKAELDTVKTELAALKGNG